MELLTRDRVIGDHVFGNGELVSRVSVLYPLRLALSVNKVIRDQFERASLSIVLNLAEGCRRLPLPINPESWWFFLNHLLPLLFQTA